MLKKRGFLKLTAGLCLIMVVLVGGIRVISGATSPAKPYECLRFDDVNGINVKFMDVASGLQFTSPFRIDPTYQSMIAEQTTSNGSYVATWYWNDIPDSGITRLYIWSRDNVRPVFIQQSPLLRNYPLVWSPDNRTLAYVWADQAQQTHLSLIDVTSWATETPDLGNVATEDLFPGWSPDGKYIGVVHDTEQGTEIAIWSIAEKRVIKTFPEASILSMEWQPNDQLSYIRRDDQGKVWIGTTASDHTEHLLDDALGAVVSNQRLIWSADKQYVAVDGDQHEVYILGVDGTVSAPIASTQYYDFWSPEGHTALLFQNQGDHFGLLVVVPHHGEQLSPKQLISIGAPTGDTIKLQMHRDIAAVTWEDVSNISHIDLINPITQQDLPLLNDGVSRSVDDLFWVGDYLVARLLDQHGVILWWIRLDGTNHHELRTIDTNLDNAVEYSAENDHILLINSLSQKTQTSITYMLDLNSGQTQPMLELPRQYIYSHPVWSPDQSGFALQRDNTVYVFDHAGDLLWREENVSGQVNSVVWTPCY